MAKQKSYTNDDIERQLLQGIFAAQKQDLAEDPFSSTADAIEGYRLPRELAQENNGINGALFQIAQGLAGGFSKGYAKKRNSEKFNPVIESMRDDPFGADLSGMDDDVKQMFTVAELLNNQDKEQMLAQAQARRDSFYEKAGFMQNPETGAYEDFQGPVEASRAAAMEEAKNPGQAAYRKMQAQQQQQQPIEPAALPEMSENSLGENINGAFGIGDTETALRAVAQASGQAPQSISSNQTGSGNNQLQKLREEAYGIGMNDEAATKYAADVSLKTLKPFEIEEKVRKEISDDPVFKQYSDMKPLLDGIARMVNRKPNAMDDGVLYSNFSRINDPGGTVQEGQLAMTKAQLSMVEQLKAKFSKEIAGGGLSATSKQEILDAARQKVLAFEGYLGTKRRPLIEEAMQRGARPEYMLPEMFVQQAEKPDMTGGQQQPGGGAPAETREQFKARRRAELMQQGGAPRG